jgi:hypothetical protein
VTPTSEDLKNPLWKPFLAWFKNNRGTLRAGVPLGYWRRPWQAFKAGNEQPQDTKEEINFGMVKKFLVDMAFMSPEDADDLIRQARESKDKVKGDGHVLPSIGSNVEQENAAPTDDPEVRGVRDQGHGVQEPQDASYGQGAETDINPGGSSWGRGG